MFECGVFSNDALLLGAAFSLDEQWIFCPSLAVWLFLREFSSGKCQWKKCGSIISTVPEVFYKVSVWVSSSRNAHPSSHGYIMLISCLVFAFSIIRSFSVGETGTILRGNLSTLCQLRLIFRKYLCQNISEDDFSIKCGQKQFWSQGRKVTHAPSTPVQGALFCIRDIGGGTQPYLFTGEKVWVLLA